MSSIPTPPPLAERWTLDPEMIFLNHGSFGATPRAVLERQTALRATMEAQPLMFLAHRFWEHLDPAREAVARFLGLADSGGLSFVRNATMGVNAILRSLELQPGDELVTTDHAYGACSKALGFVAARAGASVRLAALPMPGVADGVEELTPERAVEAVMAVVGERTRLVMLDHVTSATGLVLPVEVIGRALAERGVPLLVDGAHGPGMLPVDLDALAAAGVGYYTANMHKWICAPKGAAILWARADLRDGLHPTSISHGYQLPMSGRSPYHLEFDWLGTDDPTPALAIPCAIETVGGMLEGGWPAVMAHNRRLALDGRQLLGERLGVEPPCSEAMIGSLATVRLPDSPHPADENPFLRDPLQVDLWDRYRIEVPIVRWPAHPTRWVRIATQLYNNIEQVAALADALETLLGEGR